MPKVLPSCQVSLRGERIATSRGGCPAPRNDMQRAGRCARVQGRFRRYSGSAPWQTRTHSIFLHVTARSIVACADTRQISACHCEERSDVAIRVPAAGHSKEQYFRRKRNSLRIRPKYCQVARFPCGENGLPHQCAHWFAMTTGERGCEFAQSIAKLPGFPAGRTDCHTSVRTGSQ